MGVRKLSCRDQNPPCIRFCPSAFHSRRCSLLPMVTAPTVVEEGLTELLLLLRGPPGPGDSCCSVGICCECRLGQLSVCRTPCQGPGLLGAAGPASQAALPIPTPLRPAVLLLALASSNPLAGSPSLSSGAKLPQHDPEIAERKSNVQINCTRTRTRACTHTHTHSLSLSFPAPPSSPRGDKLAGEETPT